MPDAIRSDNGAPFASTGLHGLSRLNVWWLQLGITQQRFTPGQPQQNGAHDGLSRLNVWWLQLGITQQRFTPGQPQQNGAHERTHRTRKARATRPPAATLNTPQRAFNRFRHTYNEIRPHEALDDETPASRWTPPTRAYPERTPSPTYPGHGEVRRVSTAGTFRLHSGQHFLSQALNGEDIGLEEVRDGIWNILYYDTLLGRFDERTKAISGAPALRGKCSPCPRTPC